ncbi:NB-ARC domain-containing protein [Streptomyces sp. NPDC057621]|uniref:NB-ARC domain-containing protein n=1 Tax=Streptomyces sp. NPDC057621 TaxID=3346186 RepID=UPI0036C9A6A5
MGDIGRVDVRGEVNGQVVLGRNNVVINAEQGSYVAYRPEGPPKLRMRARPYPGVAVRPGQGDLLLGRESELAAIGNWLAAGRRVQVFGPPGIGKSALLRRYAAEQFAQGWPVLHLHAAGRMMEDLLQEILQCCYELPDGRPCEGYKPEPSTLRQLLGALQVLLVVDDLQVSSDDLGVLLEAIPGCRLLTAAVDRIERPESRPLRLDGLHEQHALNLLAREVGRYPAGAEADAARHLIQAVRGHPLTILQAAAAINTARGPNGLAGNWPWPPGIFRIDDTVLAVGTAARLSEGAISLLRPLCALHPLPVSPALLSAYGVRPNASAVAELSALRLVEADGDILRSCGPFALLVAQQTGGLPGAGQLAPPLTQWLRSGATRREACIEAAAIGRVLRDLAMQENHQGVRDLARAAAPLLALSLHWSVWGEVLRYGRAAAQFLGATADETYFAHEVHVRLVALSTAATGLVGGGGFAAAQAGGGPGGQGAPGPGPHGPNGPNGPSGPHGPGSSHGSGAGPPRPGGRALHQTGRPVRHAVASHPVAVGVGGVVLAAGGVFGAAALAGGSNPPVVGYPPAGDTPSLTSSQISPTGSATSESPTQQPSPVTTAPTGLRASSPGPGSDPCPPVSLPAQDFGTVSVGAQKTETVHFTDWLECDDEQSLKADDPTNWKTALSSCPPSQGSQDCVFQVTFAPQEPGPFQAVVTMPDDEGDQDVSMQVTGTAVTIPTEPTEPTEPTDPTSPPTSSSSPVESPPEPAPGID